MVTVSKRLTRGYKKKTPPKVSAGERMAAEVKSKDQMPRYRRGSKELKSGGQIDPLPKSQSRAESRSPRVGEPVCAAGGRC